LDEEDFVDITLIGNYPHDEHESMTRYAEMLKKLLAESGCHVEIIRPEPFLGRLKRSSRGLGKWLGYIDKYILFPISLRTYVRQRRRALKLVTSGSKEETFLVHICDQSNAVYTRWLNDVPHLVTCHDVMAIQSARGLIPGLKTGWTGQLLQGWIFSGLRNAAYIICDTRETRQDLLALAPELESRSTTIEIPLNYPYVPMPKDQAIAQLSTLDDTFKPGTDQFLFHVGGNQWYKNREGVIHVYARLCSTFPDLVRSHSLKLVLAGKPPTSAMQRLVEEEKLSGKVVLLTSVSDQQLCALYSLAEVLVYPSLKEGFGWPIIEAQACGCPVVTSDRPPMNRLAGPAALLADPEDTSSFVARVAQLLSEEPMLQQKRKDEALSHSGNFDGKLFLKQMLVKYKAILVQKN